MRTSIFVLVLLTAHTVAFGSGYFASGGGGPPADPNAIYRDGTQPPTANQPWGGFNIFELSGLSFLTDGVGDIGALAANRPGNAYVKTQVTVGDDTTSSTEVYAGLVLFKDLGAQRGFISEGDQNFPFGGNTGLNLYGGGSDLSLGLYSNQIAIGHFTPASSIDPMMHLIQNRDKNGDWGTPDEGVTMKRPRDLWVGRDFHVGRDAYIDQYLTVTGGIIDASGFFSIIPNSRQLTGATEIVSATWSDTKFEVSGDLTFAVDATKDFGFTASTNLRPRDAYIGRTVFVGSPLTGTIQQVDSSAVDAVSVPTLVVRGGNKTAGTGSGGAVSLIGGSSVGASGGLVTVTGGAISGASGSAGTLLLSGGASTTSSDTALGGDVVIASGNSVRPTAIGSSVNVTAGRNSGGGLGGTLTLAGGTTTTSATAGASILKGGRSTGGGTAGSVVLATGNSAGSTFRVTVDALGNVVLGTAALATTATDGFFHTASMPGVPTGVPTAFAGRNPYAFNSTDNILYLYNSGWKEVGAVLATGVRINTTASQPTCDSSNRGLIWVIQGGAGIADLLQVCQKNAADAYAWITQSRTVLDAVQIPATVSTASYTVLANDYFIRVCTTTNAVAITLPNPNTRRHLIIKDTCGNLGTNNLTLVRFGAENIEGVATSKVFSANFGGWDIQSDGTDWWVK